MEKALENIRQNIFDGDNVVAGISGGADSMVLLCLLLKAQQEIDFHLTVLHIEHGIRGEESKQDAEFVKTFCKNNKIDCKIINAKILQLAKSQKATIEQCARDFRYAQFEKYTSKGYKCFVAHNKTDHVETVLMHIFRGSGLDGARGIVKRENIFRPLLEYSKAQISDYARENNIPFVHDSTNDDTRYTRNFVRNQILPQIEQIYPGAINNIAKFASYCNECEELICQQIDPNWFCKKDGVAYLKREAFLKNKLVVAKAIKRAYNLCGEYADLESKHIDILIDCEKTCKNGTTNNLPHNIVWEIRQDAVVFYKKTLKNIENCTFCVGKTTFPDGKSVKICKIDEIDAFQSGKFYVDYHKIPKNAIWRTREPGDMFQKIGSRGKKKLNDYFTDKKIPFAQRDSIMLLASENNILLVLGYDISENVKVDSDTLDILKIEYVE